MASLALSIAAASPSLIHAEGPGADRRSEGSRASEPLPAERKASPQAREDRAPEAGALEDIVGSETYLRQMRIAQEALNKGNLPMAASFFQRAHDTQPEAPEPLVALADILKQTGQFEGLAKVQQVLIALRPDDPELAIDYGLSLLRLGHRTDARIQLHSALEMSDAPRIYNALGVTYDMDGDHRSAQAYYRIALENDRAYLSAMGNLGLSLALSGDVGESLAILKRLVADPSSEPKHREILAAVHAMTGDLEAAGAVAGRAFDAAAGEDAMKRYGLAPALGKDADSP